MTNGEAINWIINISADIGKAEHRDLWHYEQALSEIKEMLETAQPEPKCANGCIYGWDSTECEHCALKSAQPEEVFEIGKPHPLKGYEFCIFKDAYGDDWVEIRKYPEPLRGEGE